MTSSQKLSWLNRIIDWLVIIICAKKDSVESPAVFLSRYVDVLVPPVGRIDLERQCHRQQTGCWHDQPGVIAFYRWLVAWSLLTPFMARAVWQQRQQIRPYLRQLMVLALLGMMLNQSLGYYARAEH